MISVSAGGGHHTLPPVIFYGSPYWYSTVVLVAITAIFMPVIWWYLYSVWLFLGQPVCDVYVWSGLAYNAHPVLMYVQHNMLQSLVQCDHIHPKYYN